MQSLKSYLLRELTSLSDADPGILSDYVLALLKHDRPDLEESCVQQLADFLQEHTVPFVQKMFRHIKSLQEAEMHPKIITDDRQKREREDRRYSRIDGKRLRSRSPRPERRERDRREREKAMEDDYKHKRNRIFSATRLIVDRIPDGFCNIEAISTFFSRFGRLIDVHVEESDRRAQIEYDTKENALKAIQSPEAIFNNRFVRLYHERVPDLSANRSRQPSLPRVTTYTAPNYQPPPLPAPVNQERIKQQRMLELSKQKQGLLTAYLEQQRALLLKLETDPSLDEQTRQDIMNSLKAVDEKIYSTSVVAERPISPEIIETKPPSQRHEISRRLDLRPTSILIQPVPEQLSDGNIDAARILFGSFGTVKNVQFEEDHLVLSYANRSDAEKVF